VLKNSKKKKIIGPYITLMLLVLLVLLSFAIGR